MKLKLSKVRKRHTSSWRLTLRPTVLLSYTHCCCGEWPLRARARLTPRVTANGSESGRKLQTEKEYQWWDRGDWEYECECELQCRESDKVKVRVRRLRVGTRRGPNSIIYIRKITLIFMKIDVNIKMLTLVFLKTDVNEIILFTIMSLFFFNINFIQNRC